MSEDKLSLGAYFKQEREKKGLDLKEIEARTKISAQTLKFMEDDRLDMLPPKTFVRGFLQVIAREFELDAEGLLARMDETMAPDEEQEPYVLELDDRPLPDRHRWWVIGLVVLALILITLGFCVRQPDTETVSDGKEIWYQQEADGKGLSIETTFAA